MASTRKIVAEFLGVFLIGAIVGWLLASCFQDTKLNTIMSHWNNPDSLEARIDAKYVSDYHLTDDELTKIKPLTKQLAQDLYKVRHQFAIDILSTLDNDHALIAAQMTPEHRAAYEAKLADRRKQLSEMLLGDQDSPSPPQK